jgi:ketosteroid isomerase-like protein
MYSMGSKWWPLAIALGSMFTGCATGAGARAPDAVPDASAVLRQQTQELLDAVTAGDPRVWDRYLDPQIIYVSEAGEVEGKAQLLAEVKPLPTGISGRIEIGKLEVRQHGDVAIVFHTDEEFENYFGHQLHAQYLNVNTWQRGAAGWKQIAAQVYASLLDPPSITLPADQLDDYVGTYDLTDAIHYTVRRDGAQLVGERTGRPAQALQIEARDVCFVAGQPRSRKIFLRDSHGRVTGFADRREARDVVWPRHAAN